MNTPSPKAIETAEKIAAINDGYFITSKAAEIIQAAIDAAIENDRWKRCDVLGWEEGYKCGKAEAKVKAEMESESRPAQMRQWFEKTFLKGAESRPAGSLVGSSIGDSVRDWIAKLAADDRLWN